MPEYTAIVVEDELHARQRLIKLLEHIQQVKVVGEASNGEESLKMINELRPDIIFLDIQMPIYDGFTMLKKLEWAPKIIFTTAYSEYAIDAFEHYAIDYLLKPFSKERLEKAIEKLSILSKPWKPDVLHTLSDQLIKTRSKNSLTITQSGKVFIIPFEEIIFMRSDQKCTEIHDSGNKTLLTYDSLQKLKELLPDNFLQIHRAYLINRNYVHAIRKGFNGRLIFEMDDLEATLISTGKTYTKTVKEMLGIV